MSKPTEGNPGIGDLMKKAQEMQKKMQEVQQQISELTVTGQAGGEIIKIVVNGDKSVKSVTLDDSLLKEDKSIIEDLIVAAINDATNKIEKLSREKMSALTGIKLPEGFNLPKE